MINSNKPPQPNQMCVKTLATLVLLVSSTAFADEDGAKVLFDFADSNSSTQWQTVNDGVMGGRSDGRVRMGHDKTMTFFGTLSLENNGGFASVRSRPRNLDLQEGDTLVARLKGDGRRYTLNLYVPGRRTAYSYRVGFETKKDQWVEVRVPLEKFVATSFGRVVRDAPPVNPQLVNSIGFLLGDKKEGPFRLDVDWIKSEAPKASHVKQTVGSN